MSVDCLSTRPCFDSYFLLQEQQLLKASVAKTGDSINGHVKRFGLGVSVADVENAVDNIPGISISSDACTVMCDIVQVCILLSFHSVCDCYQALNGPRGANFPTDATTTYLSRVERHSTHA